MDLILALMRSACDSQDVFPVDQDFRIDIRGDPIQRTLAQIAMGCTVSASGQGRRQWHCTPRCWAAFYTNLGVDAMATDPLLARLDASSILCTSHHSQALQKLKRQRQAEFFGGAAG